LNWFLILFFPLKGFEGTGNIADSEELHYASPKKANKRLSFKHTSRNSTHTSSFQASVIPALKI
jgi:hypothetical protein